MPNSLRGVEVLSCIQVFETKHIVEDQYLSKIDGIQGVNNTDWNIA